MFKSLFQIYLLEPNSIFKHLIQIYQTIIDAEASSQ